MKRNRIKIVTLILVLAMMLTACAPKGNETGNDSVKKDLIIGTPYTIGTFVPWKTTADGDRYVLCNMYESLVEHNEQGGYIPMLAKSWTNADDFTWEFKLRDNSYWHTGNELFKDEEVQLKAQDVKDVFDFIMDEKNESVKRSSLTSTIDSIEVVDDFTIVFKTKEPNAMFLHVLSNIFIFPMKAVETDFDLGKYPVGSGAYKFDKYNIDDQVKLVKNDKYYIKPNADEILFKIIPDKSVAAIALQNNEIDICLQLLSTDVESVASKDNLMLVPNALGWYRYIGFNCNDPLFQDKDIRKAISMAVDLDATVKAIFANNVNATLAKRAYGPIPLEFLGADEEAWKEVSTQYDPEGAKALIESKGWKLNSDGIYEKDGQKFSFIIKTPNNDPNRMKLGVIVSTELKKIGIDCVAQPTEWATHLSDIKASNTQMFVMGGGSTPNGMNSLFHSQLSKGGSHSTNYSNPKVDELLEKAFKTIDNDKRAQLLTEASLEVIKENVHLFGYFEYVQVGVNKKVTDFDKLPSCWFALTGEYRNVGVTE